MKTGLSTATWIRMNKNHVENFPEAVNHFFHPQLIISYEKKKLAAKEG